MFDQLASPGLLVRALLFGPVTLIVIIALVRAVGLRSFSKMSAFDFIVTVSVGSLLANAAVASDWNGWFASVAAITALLGTQYMVAFARCRSARFASMIANDPVILFRQGKFNESVLLKTRVTREDVWAKLREANALDIGRVQAVVLENTGDISVLHGDEIDHALLTGVSGR